MDDGWSLDKAGGGMIQDAQEHLPEYGSKQTEITRLGLQRLGASLFLKPIETLGVTTMRNQSSR